MAAAWSELLAEDPRRPMQPEAWLDRLIEAELADRQVRSLCYQIKAARFHGPNLVQDEDNAIRIY